MTVHYSYASDSEGILFSDGQGSTQADELHGWHKQFVGLNFAVGVSGRGAILEGLFDYLADSVGTDSAVESDFLAGAIESFFDNEVVAQHHESAHVLFCHASSPSQHHVRSYYPGVFKKFGKPSPNGMLGSGSPYISDAMKRQELLGIAIPMDTLAQKLVAAMHYSGIANESLTVDDQISVVLLQNGKTYLIGDNQPGHRNCCIPIIARWDEIHTLWEPLKAHAQSINSEIKAAYRAFAGVRSGGLTRPALDTINACNSSIHSSLSSLQQDVEALIDWYDNNAR